MRCCVVMRSCSSDRRRSTMSSKPLANDSTSGVPDTRKPSVDGSGNRDTFSSSCRRGRLTFADTICEPTRTIERAPISEIPIGHNSRRLALTASALDIPTWSLPSWPSTIGTEMSIKGPCLVLKRTTCPLLSSHTCMSARGYPSENVCATTFPCASSAHR